MGPGIRSIREWKEGNGEVFKKARSRATESILRAKNGILSLGWGKGLIIGNFQSPKSSIMKL